MIGAVVHNLDKVQVKLTQLNCDVKRKKNYIGKITSLNNTG